MNHILEKFARQWLKDNLNLCSKKSQSLFVKLYSHFVKRRKGHDDGFTICEVIDSMPTIYLSRAMIQIENTLKKNEHTNTTT